LYDIKVIEKILMFYTKFADEGDNHVDKPTNIM